MEVINASIAKNGDNILIRIESGSTPIDISMTDDNPSTVKAAFNALLARLRNQGAFKIDLKLVGQDLHSQVAKEYISHLNKELEAVHAEMIRMRLKT